MSTNAARATTTILVAVDGSEGARRAVRLGADLAIQTGATLMLVNVQEPDFEPAGLDPKIDDFRRKKTNEIFDDLERYLSEPKLEVERVILDGEPAQMISELAFARKVDLVVTGRRGLGRVARAWLGSVSGRLVNICQRPVVIVP